ncbi:TrkA C-terminal domain-containing protein [Natronorubrum halophilum]|uniref:TrkA C-terminal domain-containing protein n=1 Tax=Natronorubrum halophilum TaxID=1702106 RepID=UPI0010C184ED|nr:TrkA C-terminal domain-containing protein [Natronorubrum halophilum]
MVATNQILSVFIIFALALLVVRIGAIALRMTGLSPDVAAFQAASAFSGAGYTTEEAEFTVSEPSRRTIVIWLIRLGSIGVVSAFASLLLSFINAEGENVLTLIYVLGGVIGIVLLARSQLLNRALTPILEQALDYTTDLTIQDYTQVLGLQSEYRVAEVEINEDEWLANDTARELNLSDEGVILLGVERDEDYIGAPGPDTEIQPGDTVTLYGKEDRLQELADRDEGDVEAHNEARDEHEDILSEQERVINQ